MPIEINYSKNTSRNPSANLVLFSNEKFSTNNLKRYLSESDYDYINDILKTSDLKKICLFLKSIQTKR